MPPFTYLEELPFLLPYDQAKCFTLHLINLNFRRSYVVHQINDIVNCIEEKKKIEKFFCPQRNMTSFSIFLNLYGVILDLRQLNNQSVNFSPLLLFLAIIVSLSIWGRRISLVFLCLSTIDLWNWRPLVHMLCSQMVYMSCTQVAHNTLHMYSPPYSAEHICNAKLSVITRGSKSQPSSTTFMIQSSKQRKPSISQYQHHSEIVRYWPFFTGYIPILWHRMSLSL